MKKNNSKVPGILLPPPKNEIDGIIDNLTAKSVIELIELRNRQMKLLENRLFLNKLADKGVKIRTFLNKIILELKLKQEQEKTCQLLSKLSLNSHDKDFVENIEWDAKLKKNQNTYLDSDDNSEPEDILHILTQNTAHEKKVIFIQPEKLLVTPEDIVSIGEEPHIKYIVNKTENNVKARAIGNFKPFKTTLSNVHNPDKELLRKRNKYWEVTAATPPPIVNGPAKVLSIEESLKLQKDYNLHIKEIGAKHAAEKLLAKSGIKMGELPGNVDFGKYRTVDSDDTSSHGSGLEGSDNEIHDEEPERGGVVFTVIK